MKSNEIVKFALDIGNHSIKLLAGTMSSKCDKISIIDYIKVRSKGIKKSNIEDPEALLESIREAVTKLSEKLECQIDKVSLAIGGAGIVSATRIAKLSFPEREVVDEDVEELYEQAKKRLFGTRDSDIYSILYREMYNIRVNNAGIVKRPVGMLVKDLQADVHMVYVEEAYVEKYIEIINKLGIEVEEVYLSPYVSAKGTLDEESKKMGVAHVDIGFSSTDIIILKNYKVLYAKTISIGETHYISDMMHGIGGLTKEDAMEILDKFKRKEIENDNTIRYGMKKVSLRDIRDVIQARTGDITEFITSTIDSSGFNGYLAKGIVLTGGAVAIEGVAEQIGKSGYLVRKELPIEIKGLKEAFYSDAVVTGIFLEDMEKEYRKYIEKSIAAEQKEQQEAEEAAKRKAENIDEILDEEDSDDKKSWIRKILEFF